MARRLESGRMNSQQGGHAIPRRGSRNPTQGGLRDLVGAVLTAAGLRRLLPRRLKRRRKRSRPRIRLVYQESAQAAAPPLPVMVRPVLPLKIPARGTLPMLVPRLRLVLRPLPAPPSQSGRQWRLLRLALVHALFSFACLALLPARPLSIPTALGVGFAIIVFISLPGIFGQLCVKK